MDPRRLMLQRGSSVDWIVVGLAAVVVVLAAASGGDTAADGSGRGFDPLAIGLLVLGVAIVVAGGRFPATAALAALALTFAWYAIGYTNGLINVITLAAYYRLGVSERSGRKLVTVSATVVATLLTMAVVGDEGWSQALAASGYVLTAVLFGELIRNRRLLVAEYAERAHRAEADAERRLTEERLRIARDVHDVLAHTVSTMTVQAGVALDAVDRDPEAAANALSTLRASGREAMDEVRATVAVLRAGHHDGVRPPAPRLDQLGPLVDAARARGVEVRLDVSLPDSPLPELVELTVYRVVQEALTNVTRHADGATATVTIGADAGALVVEICDTGVASGTPGPSEAGFGLRGMAERVESIGGQLWHGRDQSGGFVVRATIPVPGGPT